MENGCLCLQQIQIVVDAHVLKATEIRYKNMERNYGNPITAMNPQQIQSNDDKKNRNPKWERNRVGEKRRVLTIAAAMDY